MKILFTFALSLLVAQSAFSLTLKETKTFAEWKKELSDPENTKSTKDACGFVPPATIDEAFVTPFMEKNTSASSYCEEAYSALRRLCVDDVGKETVKKNISKIVCKNGKPESLDIKLSGKELQLTFGPGASNIADKIKDYLENNMK